MEGRVRRWGGSDRQVRCWKRLPERRTEDPHDLLPQVPGENMGEGQVGEMPGQFGRVQSGVKQKAQAGASPSELCGG